MAVAALILAAIVSEAAPSHAARQISVQRWIDAHTHAIARIQNPKERLTAQKRFAETRALLRREEARSLTVAPLQDPQRLARSILNNRRLYRFMQPAQPYRRPWWQRLFDWLSERWSRVLRAIFGRATLPAPVNRRIADALLGLSILVFLALLGRIIWLYGRRARSKSIAVPLAIPDDPANLLRLSMRAAERGNYALAVTQLFAAAVALLMIKKRFDGHASETVREMGRRVGSDDPQLREPFDQLTDSLTRAVYAEHPIVFDDWTRSLGAYHRLEGLVRS